MRPTRKAVLRMKRVPVWIAVLSVLPAFSIQPSRAAVASVVNTTSDLPEVLVESKRLSQMRRDISRTEDRFYALFNKLNTDDEFDVHCSMSTETGTHLQKRVCLVQFYETAREEWVQLGLGGGYAPHPDLVALERGPEYRRKALEVINAHPELRRLVKERDALEKKYLRTRKERLKGHWFAF
jgi:hypothetical protein